MRYVKPILADNLLHPLHKVVQGVFFMCRQHVLWGCILIAFGVGFLIGSWVEGGFLSHCFAIGIAVVGLSMLRK